MKWVFVWEMNCPYFLCWILQLVLVLASACIWILVLRSENCKFAAMDFLFSLLRLVWVVFVICLLI